MIWIAIVLVFATLVSMAYLILSGTDESPEDMFNRINNLEETEDDK